MRDRARAFSASTARGLLGLFNRIDDLHGESSIEGANVSGFTLHHHGDVLGVASQFDRIVVAAMMMETSLLCFTVSNL